MVIYLITDYLIINEVVQLKPNAILAFDLHITEFLLFLININILILQNFSQYEKSSRTRKEGMVLFNDALNTFVTFTVIWCQTYCKGPFR